MRCLKIALMLVGLLATVQQSQQFNLKTISNLVSEETKSSEAQTSYFGLIFDSDSTEKALNDSGLFTLTDFADYLGRRIVAGTIYGSPVVYIKSHSTPSIHVGITTQILANFFNLRGVIYVGTAGTTNDTISLGSVVVPGQIAFTGAWNWLSNNASEKGQLVFGKFNIPYAGENLLGSVAYEESDIYTKEGVNGTRFWIPIDSEWLQYASRVEIDGGDVIVGVNGSSSDIYVNNPSYREFLYKIFQVSTVDTTSAAVALAASGNNAKFIAFEGISNKAGATGESENELANANAVKVVGRFIWLLTVPRAQPE